MPTTVPALRVPAAPPAARPTTGTPPPSSRPGRPARRAAAPPAPAGSAGTTTAQHVIDVHQHLWPPELIEALRRRAHPPRIDGWTLLLEGEPPYEIDPADHDPARRRGLDRGRVVIGLSSPLGIEDLDPRVAAPLLDAWHEGAAALAPGFEAWASVTRAEPDLAGLAGRLDAGFAGLQVPATWLGTPAAVDRLAPALAVVAAADRPVFVHPGPARPPAGGAGDSHDDGLPPWWAAVVDYPGQLQAAWWSWQAAGRHVAPDLRICFAAGAGLAPVHHERYLARGGRPLVLHPGTFVDTSSYARQGVDSLVRVLGVDSIVLGSDRPYGEVTATDLGDAAQVAFSITNPLRLLEGARP